MSFPGQPQQPPQVPPQPLPTVINVGQVLVNGQAMVLMQFQTPAGVQIHFLDAEAALRVANQLRTEGRAARSGLTLPAGVSSLNGHHDDEDGS